VSNIKYNLEIAKKIFKDGGCKLLEKKYIQCKTPMKYKCTCGGISKITIQSFINGRRCKQCAINNSRYSYQEVYDFFKEQGCELLSKKYLRQTQYLKYKCICGDIAKTEFRIFKSTKRLCRKCCIARKIEAEKKKYNGKMYFQTKEFRKRYKETIFKKYGVKHISKSKMIRKRAEKTLLKKYGVKCALQSEKVKKKMRKTLMKKYGVKHCSQIKGFGDKVKQTMLKRYGVPSGAYLINPCSKESQKLFWKLHKKLPPEISAKNHFGKLNSEFVANIGKNYFKYDFVNSLVKKAIEYNGTRFHPKSYQKDDEIGWCVFHLNKTVKEAREYEKLKYSVLENRGYKFLTVWDHELKSNPKQLVKKCMDFLLG